VDRCGQIILRTHVPHFVSNNRLQLRVVQALGNSFRPNQDRPDYAENTWFERSWRHQQLDPLPYSSQTLQAAQRFYFPPLP
jgi:hypothetical protein